MITQYSVMPMVRVAVIVTGAVLVGLLVGAIVSLLSSPHPHETKAAPKADKLTVSALVAHRVPTTKIAGEIILVPEVVLPPVTAPPERELLEVKQPADTLPPPRRRHDPCARWGGHKIVTHGGRYWHCRYG